MRIAADAVTWVESFVEWYNMQHMHSGIKFVTPQQRHSGLDQAILAKRHQVYQTAKQQNPERWSGNTRNWSQAKFVTLNPELKFKGNCVDAYERNLAAA